MTGEADNLLLLWSNQKVNQVKKVNCGQPVWETRTWSL